MARPYTGWRETGEAATRPYDSSGLRICHAIGTM